MRVDRKFKQLTHRQMAKRMKFSVVGLPHYTIWHLYEPSVDDIRHMEQMEAERKARELADKEKAEKLAAIESLFGVSSDKKDELKENTIANQGEGKASDDAADFEANKKAQQGPIKGEDEVKEPVKRKG